MPDQLPERDSVLVDLMSSITAGLKMLGYQGTHFTGFKNPDNGGLVMLSISPDGKYHFAIEVRIWQETPGVPTDHEEME